MLSRLKNNRNKSTIKINQSAWKQTEADIAMHTHSIGNKNASEKWSTQKSKEWRENKKHEGNAVLVAWNYWCILVCSQLSPRQYILTTHSFILLLLVNCFLVYRPKTPCILGFVSSHHRMSFIACTVLFWTLERRVDRFSVLHVDIWLKHCLKLGQLRTGCRVSIC